MAFLNAGGENVISWAVRDELLARVADLPGGAAVIERFQRFRILATVEEPLGRDGVAFDGIWIVEPVDESLDA